ncbi:hypothetical protein SAMN04488515_3276 [Cognatiyoonia koreensis]|uniref:Uncharacterized protein n=1 Tax=Cognatiyoonia koreensis TaxID=364200 RepID=A0A1I0RUI4_9RHOB|nr:hypothetical protein [Cognatiyoonia koreensis]SEW45036.1 hypothetical protein SAMN04488515_3276 [Cognatiyoonia koreensis]
MRFTKSLAAAAVFAMAGSTVSAGGLGDTIIVTPPPPPAEVSSINSGYIVLGLLAALVAASGSF